MRPPEVSIRKFDILATYVYAKALLDGLDDDQARQRGMVAAIMGAKARLGGGTHHEQDFEADKQAAEKKKKFTITAEAFDHQVADKMGDFFDRTFFPAMGVLSAAVQKLSLRDGATDGSLVRASKVRDAQATASR
ncbi:MAG: hypothetical protein P4L84_04085 [Isosphaeraceae bacterium]|nr:hypothetical protein [Isosphaeraceae bacterium]